MITSRDFFGYVLKGVQYNKFEKQARSPMFLPIQDRLPYDIANWFDMNLQLLPFQLLNLITFIQNDQLTTGIAQGKKGINFLNFAYDQIDNFMSRAWFFDSTNLVKVSNSLSPAMREMFPVDPIGIDWETLA